MVGNLDIMGFAASLSIFSDDFGRVLGFNNRVRTYRTHPRAIQVGCVSQGMHATGGRLRFVTAG